MVYEQLSDALQELEQVKAERDALAAHLERLREAGEKLATELEQWSLTEHHDETDAAFDSWSYAVSQQPTTSLDRLKAEWQVDLMEQARRVRNYSNPHDVFEAIPVAALEGELRRQAGG